VRLFILSGQSNMVGLDPDVSFTPAVKAAFPGDEVLVVHSASSGKLIRNWCRDWTPPPGQEEPRGRSGVLYDELIRCVRAALEGKPRPLRVTFVWMQGEADAKFAGYGKLYGPALAGIVAQLRKDLGREDLDVVVGRISDYGNDRPEERPDWHAVRDAQVKFAEELPRGAWVDTDDLNGDQNGLHYGKQGYATLGERFAKKAIELASRP
jgi:hypothetical protein